MKKRLLPIIMLVIMISCHYALTPVHSSDTVTWKVLWLICPEVAASTAAMSEEDIDAVKSVSLDFADFIYESTKHALQVDIDIKISEYTVETLTKSSGYYWLSPQDIQRELDEYAPDHVYDSVIVTARLDGVDTSINWGLTGGESFSEGTNCAGYSTVQMLEGWDLKYLKKSADNPHPEGVYVHEWIHQLEFFYNSAGLSVPVLHDYKKYGYADETSFNIDFLSNNVTGHEAREKSGVSADMWKIKPSEVYKKNFYPANNATHVDVKPIIGVTYDYPVNWYPYEGYNKGYAFLLEYNDDGSFKQSIAIPIDDSSFSADKKTLTLDVYLLTGTALAPHTKYSFYLNDCLTALSPTYRQPFFTSYFTTGFNDVHSSAWYADAVNTMSERGIAKNISGPEYFEPNKELTRAECIVMLMRAFDISPKPGDNFNDAGNAYYTDYLAEAKRLGLTEGVGNNLFAPDQKITRQELFAFTYNVLDKLKKLPVKENNSASIDAFSDAGSVDTWARDAIDYLVKAKIVSGTSGNKLNPASPCTRAEMSQIIYNLCF